MRKVDRGTPTGMGAKSGVKVPGESPGFRPDRGLHMPTKTTASSVKPAPHQSPSGHNGGKGG